MFDSKKIGLIALLGTLAFVSTGFLPSPIDKMVIGFQALCFSLAALFVSRGGATLTCFVTGLLLSVLRPGFFPFSLLFSLFYGILIDGFYVLFNVKEDGRINSKRLILLLTVATGITGVVSMYLTTLLSVIPMMPTMYLMILIGAVINGIIAGYLTIVIWNRYFNKK
ncbi:MAG: hypothetical protein ACOWW1_06020 [archaeon]|nr:hypothetical protein [Candidatus Bathyarchaeum sp.]